MTEKLTASPLTLPRPRGRVRKGVPTGGALPSINLNIQAVILGNEDQEADRNVGLPRMIKILAKI
jgi:hypothetical protein